MAKSISPDNDTVYEIDGLKDSITGVFANGATVTLTIYDENIKEVDGITWPQTMAFVTGSNGKYRVVIDKAINISSGRKYIGIITVVDGSSNAEFEIDLEATTRKG